MGNHATIIFDNPANPISIQLRKLFFLSESKIHYFQRVDDSITTLSSFGYITKKQKSDLRARLFERMKLAKRIDEARRKHNKAR